MVKIQIKYTSSINQQVAAFEDRVIANGGTFEATQCCIDYLKTLGNDAEYGGYLDVKEGASFPLNFSVGDIRDLTKRTGAFSKTITLVGNKNNHNILGHHYDVNIEEGTFNINTITKCAVLQNGIPIMDDALLQLVNVRKSQMTDAYEQMVEYDVLVKDTQCEFYTAITNKELTDLDFSDLNHTFTAADIIATFDNTVTDGFKYVFPYSSTGSNQYQVRQFKPAIYAKQYFDRIFSNAGFTYEWTGLTAAHFDKLLIPYNGDANTFDTEDYLVEAEITTPFHVDSSVQSYGNFDNATGWTEITDLQSSFNPSTGVFTVPFDTSLNSMQGYTISYEVDYSLFLDNNSGINVVNSNAAFITRPRIRATIAGYESQLSNIAPSSTVPINTTLTTSGLALDSGVKTGGMFLAQNVANGSELNTGDQAQIEIGIYQTYGAFFGAGVVQPVDVVLTINSLRIRILPTQNVQVIGGTLAINEYIPLKIKQSDYIKSIFQMYNLYAEINIDQPNTLTLRHRDEFYDNGAEKDWTYKLMKDKEQNLLFLPDVTSKKLKLTYKADTDSANLVYTQMTDEIYGQIEYTFDSEYVKDTDTKELIFSPTPVILNSINGYVPILDGESPQTNIRILYDGGVQTCGSYGLVEYGTTGVFNNTTYPMLGHFDNALTPTFDINFGMCDYYFYSPQSLTANNLYNNYWRRTVNQINVGKMLTTYFNLAEDDIQTLKLNDKIRIDNSWWNINKVIDYDANTSAPTKVELISVDSDIDLAPFKTKPGTPTSPLTSVNSVESVLATKSMQTNANLSGDDVLVRGTGNIIGDGLRGIVIGDNKVLNQDGIITPQINGINFQSKGYIALLNQLSTSAPKVIEFSNTIGQITWTRTAQGEYLGTPLIPLNTLTTFVTIGNTEHDYLATANINTDGNVVVRTTKTSNHHHTDGRLNYSPLEIRVYE